MDRTVVSRKTGGESVRARTLTSGRIEVQVAAEPQALPPQLAKQFDVVAKLGGGSQGLVLRVRPKGATKDYALKWVAADDADDAAGREERLAALEPHDNVVPPLQVGRVEGRRYVVFDLVEGQSLEQWVEREGRLAPAVVVEVAYQLLRALAHIHAQGVVHRDVKPGNVLVSAAGLVRLTDFGLATTAGADPGGFILGTPRYMAPEQIRAEPAHPASDVYAVGCVVHHLLAGDTPFGGDSIVEIVSHQLNDAPAPLGELAPDVPAPLAALVLKCLEKSIADRPADGKQALAELARGARAAALPEPVVLAARPASRPLVRPRSPDPASRRARAAVAPAAGALALFALGVMLGFSGWSRLFVWPAFLACAALCVHALTVWSTATLGRANAWWRAWADADLLSSHAQALTGAFAAGVAAVIALLIGMPAESAGPVPAALCVTLALLGVPALCRGRSALAEHDAAPPAAESGPMDLALHFKELDWEFELTPAGHRGKLPGRVALAPGLNRLTVGRAGKPRRTFLIWGLGPLSMYAAKLDDAADGPALAEHRR